MLYKHQQELLDKNPPKWLLCHDTGTGKTLTAIELANKNATLVLVVCPKSVLEKWRREMAQCSVKWLVVTKEEFRRDWDKYSILIDAIIVDEAHHFSNYGSQMSKNLLKFIHKVQPRFVWLLTATPMRREPLNVWTLARYLGVKWPFMEFRGHFYRPQYFGTRVVWVPKDGIKDEIAGLVNKIGNTVRIDECADIPEQVFEDEDIALTKEQERAIKHIEETETAAIVKFTKIHQVEQSCLKSDGYIEDQIFDNNKNERILELCESVNKAAVFCRYNLQITILKDYLSKNLSRPIYIIQGITKKRDAVTLEIEKQKECIVIINCDTAEGYELSSIGLIIFASMSFSFTSYKQALGRFLRINKLKKNVYIHLITAGDSIDRAIYNAIMNKQSFDIAIYKRNEKR